MASDHKLHPTEIGREFIAASAPYAVDHATCQAWAGMQGPVTVARAARYSMILNGRQPWQMQHGFSPKEAALMCSGSQIGSTLKEVRTVRWSFSMQTLTGNAAIRPDVRHGLVQWFTDSQAGCAALESMLGNEQIRQLYVMALKYDIGMHDSGCHAHTRDDAWDDAEWARWPRAPNCLDRSSLLLCPAPQLVKATASRSYRGPL